VKPDSLSQFTSPAHIVFAVEEDSVVLVVYNCELLNIGQPWIKNEYNNRYSKLILVNVLLAKTVISLWSEFEYIEDCEANNIKSLVKSENKVSINISIDGGS